ncbi:MAG: glycine zipper domain-containing protein [Sulfurovum sp.]|nr:glycine zipper domain-containing protein [Sulfurovum sp.]
MKKTVFVLLFSSTLFLMNGCTGNEVVPNNATQTGVVTGALAGSIIGYNAGDHSGKDAALGAIAGAAAGGLIGNAVDQSNPEPVNTGGWHE